MGKDPVDRWCQHFLEKYKRVGPEPDAQQTNRNMLGLSANLKYYLFNGDVDMRRGIFRLCEQIRSELSMDPSDTTCVYMFMSKSRRIIKLLHYERGFYVLYEKRPVQGKFKKPVFDEMSRSYQICWSDMAYLTESLVVERMSINKVGL